MEIDEAILKDMIFEKDYECPICKNIIKQKVIKSSKNKLLDVDYDLNKRYQVVNPLNYEMVVCEICGFAQLNKREEKLTIAEAQLIRDKISMNFLGRKYNTFYSIEEAIDRYKLGLLNAIVRNATEGEKAYLALKIGWLYREMGNEQGEKRFLGEALKGFLEAYQKEGFPIFELQEDIVCYLISALSYKMENYSQAKRWLQALVGRKNISPKLKNRCFTLSDMIRNREKEIKEQEVEQE